MNFEGNILIVGAHPDDIEFGMGGTLNQLTKKDIVLCVFSNTLNYPGNDSIVEDLDKSMKVYDIPYNLFNFTNMNFHNEKSEICQKLFEIRKIWSPEIIFSTNPKSVNPDHSTLGNCVEAVFQECNVLFYETIRGDYKHIPHLYNELGADDFMTKLRALDCYSSQKQRSYMGPDRVASFAYMRGVQANMKYAETFEISRLVRRL